MHGDRHDHLFEGRIAGALADAVDAELDLPRPRAHGRHGVRRGHAEVVLPVERQDRALELGDGLAQIAEQIGHVMGKRVADRVGNVDGAGAGREGCANQLRQEGPIGAGRVHGRELDVAHGLVRARDHRPGELEHVVVIRGATGGRAAPRWR